jgi:hypothetical protein
MAHEKNETFYVNSPVQTAVAAVADDLEQNLRFRGYEVSRTALAGGDVLVSVTKGGFFRTVAGFKTALNISLRIVPPGDRAFQATVSVGLFESQVVPSAITLLFFWPLIITQVWGYAKNVRLDDEILALIRQTVAARQAPSPATSAPPPPASFCPHCGHPASGNFCSTCGKPLD